MTPARCHTVFEEIFHYDLQLKILHASAATFCLQEKHSLLPRTRRRTGPI